MEENKIEIEITSNTKELNKDLQTTKKLLEDIKELSQEVKNLKLFT